MFGGGFWPNGGLGAGGGRGRVTRMAGSLRRLIEDLAVVKPGRKTSRALSDAAKAALGLSLPITEVLDNTLGPGAPRSAGAATADGVTH
jgi:hypothetical protein